MKVHFYLRYYTTYGQSLAISGNCAALGNDDPAKALTMEYVHEELWHAAIEVAVSECPSLVYRYHFRDKDGSISTEWGERTLDLRQWESAGALQVSDEWNAPGAIEQVFLTQPFQPRGERSRGTGSTSPLPPGKGPGVGLFRVKAPLLGENEVICLSGHGEALGAWDTEKPLFLEQNGSEWSLMVDLSGQEDFPLSYKYGLWNVRLKELIRFEDGPNRTLLGLPVSAPAKKAKAVNKEGGKSSKSESGRGAALQQDGFFRKAYDAWRGAGVAIPVFSLRSERSFGVGEFTDLPLLADWAKAAGLKLIQLLPINDTSARHTWEDCYPYAAISAFALHPLYLNMEEVAGEKHAALLQPFAEKGKLLNSLNAVDYESVMAAKREMIRLLYHAQKDAWQQDRGWLAYFEENKHWLVPYAAFCYLRDQNGTADFSIWESHRVYKESEIEKLVSPKAAHYDQIAVHYFTQWQLHRQLRAAADYLHQHGLALKGDIAIGIYRHSCDAWMAPELYNMDQQAGAPPDDFAEKGQNWGFPTYNWERMKQDGFAWWRQRFAQMSGYFDAFRIDHILGFFRIWSIPLDAVEGIMGRFVPALPVQAKEFEDAGMGFDFGRLCEPYITDQVLDEIFGQEAGAVRDQFLSRRTDGHALSGGSQYALKTQFATQRQVEAFFNGLPPAERNDRLRDGLYALISNVILFPEEKLPKPEKGKPKGKTAFPETPNFHFRFGIEKTTSFRHLESWVQEKIKAIYNDYFYKRQDEFWEKEAMEKLPALKRSTNMLICGEDLGMVPHCVPDVMKELGLLSLEIQRMPKQLGATFAHPKDAPYLSVVTPSTHDMSTIRGWWEEDRALTQRFFNESLGYPGDAPYFCEPWANWAIVRQHLQSPAMWSIFQLQDLLGISDDLRRENPHEERINIPADPKHYWRYRMHLRLEDLLGAGWFNASVRRMVKDAGR